MKPTKLLILEKSAKWWLNEKSNNIGFAFSHKNDWWIVKSSKPTKKPAEKPTTFLKKATVFRSRQNGNHLTLLLLAAALGISLALNLLNFLWL